MFSLQPHLKNNYLIINHRSPMLTALHGSDIGIPLNIFSNIYTNLHYGYDITTINSVCLQFLLGFYVYGTDRIKDMLEYKNLNQTDTDKIIIYQSNKIELYDKLYNNKQLYDTSLSIALFGIIYILYPR